MACVPATAPAEVPLPPERPSHNLFGVTGLIDTPTAQMQPDAQISLTSSYFGGFYRNTVSFQVLPFLEGAFRYSVLDEFFPDDSVRRALYDRSFDVKLRLVEEGVYWPSVAVGLQDFLGTGVYSGEYVVASKDFLGGDLTVTGGMGWGRFASLNGFNNPIGWYLDSFRTREEPRSGGGDVNFGSFFKGDAGFFGGVSWRTPLDGLSLKIEYSNDAYTREQEFSDFDQSIPINLGIEYRPTSWAEIGAYYMYGQEFGLRLTLSGNILDPAFGAEDEPAPLPVLPRPVDDAARARAAAELGEVRDLIDGARSSSFFGEAPIAGVTVEERLGGVRWARARLAASADHACPVTEARAIDAEYGVVDAVSFETPDGAVVCTLALRPAGETAIRLTRRAALDYPTGWAGDPDREAAIRARLAEDMAGNGVRLVALTLEPTAATLLIENDRFNQMPRAIGRAARSMARVLPPSVERFEIVPVEAGVPTVTVAFARSVLEDRVDRPDAAHLTWSTAEVTDAPRLSGAALEQALGAYPQLAWAIEPLIPVSLFDPDEPVRADLQLAISGSVAFAPGASVTGTLTKRIVGNLDDITRTSDSTLPHVRSDFAEYLDEGDPGLTRLTADYVTKLAPSVYGRVSGGLLERMFAGIQGELLWRPADQSWGVGGEIAYVRQRDFDTLFDLQAYDVVTGHVSLYWDTPFHGLSLQLDAGRYLAGDWGGTVGVKRRFSNGWEIGAFATFTDVSFDEFGEGSFDKGIYVSIPLNWTLPYESRSRLASVIRPLSRDGGQRLQIANRLNPLVEDLGSGPLASRSEGFWE
ncbi:YjbH domain-containing protein [Paralimibaculum aggregatum]|uniref:YjbH domain-containing protein n=1 Tax=Paralimibaculum aggregatum TaxID=3036245 RepID=UPI002556C694|nr:YjbH domain-containing protein [Limibaculum sp. NKW23]